MYNTPLFQLEQCSNSAQMTDAINLEIRGKQKQLPLKLEIFSHFFEPVCLTSASFSCAKTEVASEWRQHLS